MTSPAEHVRYVWRNWHRYRVVVGNHGGRTVEIHDCRPKRCGDEREDDDVPFTERELAEILARNEP